MPRYFFDVINGTGTAHDHQGREFNCPDGAKRQGELIAIDPAPRADIAKTGARTIATSVPACGMAPFAGLAAGDLLFIDSSHVLMPGSDVDFLLNQILPGLPAGVLVHVHDIFLPDGYPAEWAWRGYNEQLGVAALLTGGAWRLLFASRYAAHVDAGLADLHPSRFGDPSDLDPVGA